MLNLAISASLCWLGARASGDYFVVTQGRCEDEGGESITDPDECMAAKEALPGYSQYFFEVDGTSYPPGCTGDTYSEYVYFNESPVGTECGSRFNVVFKFDCFCKTADAGGGEGSGDDGDDSADKVCIDVRKRRACKALDYCNFDRKASPMCTDKDPAVKIPIKEFCEIIHVRGWCKRVSECFWTGEKCMLKSEAACTDVAKRRICSPLRAKNGGCLNGKNCFWTGRNCLESGSC